MTPWAKALTAILLVAGLAVFAAGVGLIVIRQTDTRALATVDHCTTSGGSRNYRVDCTGHWTLDGHQVFGTVDGVSQSAVGKHVSVTVSGTTAHSRSLTLPLVLLGLGLIVLALVAVLVRAVTMTSRRRANTATTPT
jgi:hypothetical protein